MEDKKRNIFLGIVLVILMIVAIVIVIINPNKIKKTKEISVNEKQENVNLISNNVTKEEYIQEEKRMSMQEGNKFCKIDNKIVFYNEDNKTIYLYDLNENKTSKIATAENGVDKMYFDGESIYFMPSYYMGKGIYKVDLQGNVNKITENSSLQLYLTDDKIYFVKQIGYDQINNNPQGTLSSMDKNGENITTIAENVKNYFYIQGDKIYYTTQDRKMYSIGLDGTNKQNILSGRKFIIGTSDKYIIYIDYASQEAKHILNLETNEDTIVGYFGRIYNFQNKKFLQVCRSLDDGSLDDKFSLLEVNEDGTVKDYGNNISDFAINYIINGNVYLYSNQNSAQVYNVETKQTESKDEYEGFKYFVGGNAYKIDDSNIEDIKIEKIKL